uniref:Uncharacterized protein n=1 Tax=Leersia perrieri TaxID=77586 RepID=A0A0D9XFD2_9ORYZ
MAELQLGQSMTVESSTWTRKPSACPVHSPPPPKEAYPRAAAIAVEEVNGAVIADASRLQMLGLAWCAWGRAGDVGGDLIAVAVAVAADELDEVENEASMAPVVSSGERGVKGKDGNSPMKGGGMN